MRKAIGKLGFMHWLVGAIILFLCTGAAYSKDTVINLPINLTNGEPELIMIGLPLGWGFDSYSGEKVSSEIHDDGFELNLKNVHFTNFVVR